jgi:cation transport ATPase
MPILRLAYTTLFLIALLAVFELWSQVGGQSHLDLMPWYLKLVLGAGAAFSVVKAAAAAVSGERSWNRQTLRWAAIMLAFLIGCGLASYYAHLYLEEEEQEEQNVSEDFHPQAVEHARHTKKNPASWDHPPGRVVQI